MAIDPKIPPGLVIKQTPDISNNSSEGFPFNLKNYVTPRSQRDAGMSVEPLPDRISFRDAEPLSNRVDRDVVIVASVCAVVWLVANLFWG